MAVEAAVRVLRAGGEASQMLQGLSRDARAALRELEAINPAVARSARVWEVLNAQMQAGKDLSTEQHARYKQLGEALRQRAEAAARGGGPSLGRPLTPEERQQYRERYTEEELDRARLARPGMIVVPKVPPLPTGAAPAADAPEPARSRPAAAGAPLTQDEDAHLRSLGYTDAERTRARRLGEGRFLIPQPTAPPVAPPPETPPRPSQPQAAAAEAATATPAPAPERRARTEPTDATDQRRHDATETEQTVERERNAYQRLTHEKQLNGLSDRELRREWRANQVELRQQDRDLDRTVNQFERLRTTRTRVDMSAHQARLDQARERLEDLRMGREALMERQAALRAEAEGRGLRPEGDVLAGGGGGGTGARQLAGAFLGGAGMGGGSPIGLVAGAAFGYLNPWVAAATLAGAGFGYALSPTGVYPDTQRQTFETGMQLGGGFDRMRADAMIGLRGPARVRYEESLDARRALAIQTGRTDVRGVAELARAYGLPVGQTAGMVATLGTVGRLPDESVTRRRVPMTPDEVAGAVARERRVATQAGRPPRLLTGADLFRNEESTRGGIAPVLAGAYQTSAYGAFLPAERRDALMGTFLQNVLRLTQMQAQGGAPVADFGTVPGMLSAATRFMGPDLAPGMAGERVGAFMQSIMQPQGDMLRGLQLRAVMNLGRQMTPEQLAAFRSRTGETVAGGIDLTSYTGATAAMQNVFSLPRREQEMLLRAIVTARQQVTGHGTEAERMFLTQQAGGRAAIGIDLQQLQERLINSPPGTEAAGDLTEKIREKMTAAGTEAKPFELELEQQELAIRAGKPLKDLGQSIRTMVYEFADEIGDALNRWDQQVGTRPGIEGTR